MSRGVGSGSGPRLGNRTEDAHVKKFGRAAFSDSGFQARSLPEAWEEFNRRTAARTAFPFGHIHRYCFFVGAMAALFLVSVAMSGPRPARLLKRLRVDSEEGARNALNDAMDTVFDASGPGN